MDSRIVKFFILEDDPLDQELIKRTLKKNYDSCTITTASTKEDFYQKLQWSQPDLIISDYNLPGFNGLEALLHIKEKHPHIPFIFVTGMLQDEELAAGAILKGAAGYLLKQNMKQLPALVNTVLDKYRLHTQAKEAARQKIRQRQIMYQKLQALLDTSNDFPMREEALNILNKLLSKE
jgi:DNA-binding NarL/FixJ family response regulator